MNRAVQYLSDAITRGLIASRLGPTAQIWRVYISQGLYNDLLKELGLPQGDRVRVSGVAAEIGWNTLEYNARVDYRLPQENNRGLENIIDVTFDL